MYGRTLRLSGNMIVRKTHDELFDELAFAIMGAGAKAVEDRGEFHIALSGGSTPEPFYMHLVIDPRYREIPWDKTHVWIVDERRVAEDHEQSNIRMIRETLVDHVPMRSRQIHAIPVMDDDVADRYEKQLRKHLQGAPGGSGGRLDFILLGMGDDGHTASLFPGSPAQQIEDRWVAVNSGPTVTPPDRVTMTYPLLNGARQLAVLVTGAKKNATLNRVDQQLYDHGPDIARLPITGIVPLEGELTWYLDNDAAGDDS